MALLQTPQLGYLTTDYVHVDSEQRLAQSRSGFDVVIDLGKAFRDITSVEIVNWNIPRDIAPSFVEASNGEPGNNMLDIFLDHALGPETLSYSVAIASNTRFTDTSAFLTYLTSLLNDEMDAQGDAFFNTANNVAWDLALVSLTNFGVQGRFTAQVLLNAAEGDIYAYFLFGTGANRANSAWQPLGFKENIDTTINLDPPGILSPVYGPQGFTYTDLESFHYVDVFVTEAEPGLGNNIPMTRIFLTDNKRTFWRRTDTTTSETRLLAPPIRYAERLRVRLRLRGDREPSPFSAQGWDLTLKIHAVEQQPILPNWIDQTQDLL